MQYPYNKDHGINGLKFRFFTPEASAWYDPLKPYTLLEYQWVRDNIDLNGQVVADAGAHHGNYSVVFKGAYNVIAFEMIAEYCRYAHENMTLNGMRNFQVLCVKLNGRMNMRDMMPQPPDIVKMDIEGDEFEVLPVELIDNPQVHTWILELHPVKDPNLLARLFVDEFELLKVDRERMEVRPYTMGESWPTHATLIARK